MQSTSDRIYKEIFRYTEHFYDLMREQIKQEQEFYKFFVTINSTAIFILIAFHEHIIKASSGWWIFPLLLLLISLAFSTYCLICIGNIYIAITDYQAGFAHIWISGKYDEEKQSKKGDELHKKLEKNKHKLAGMISTVSYFLAIFSLIMLTILNLIINQN
ncbi:MAG: hypothetical protein H5U05_06630 [Candidatus Aminicenantes bacterium]|nr:hypothetical protein [Candidatus Aminicenantes bacterium]